MVSLAAHHEVFGVSLAPFTMTGAHFTNTITVQGFFGAIPNFINLKLGDGSNHGNLPQDPNESSLFPHFSY
jgi:hypothetical protein